MQITAWQIVLAMSIPSGITGFCFWLLEHRLQKKEARAEAKRKVQQEKAEEQEKRRENYQLYLVKSVGAAIALGEATARAVARIPDAHCNGDMHAALEYAEKVKHEQKDFLTQQAIEALQD
ncbi:MAG: serine/threonine protein kinase [Lachnospiraceae bacterium]|nr:serine/threonine protein kinase [Lachnospiraceae bacterium]